MKPTARIAVFTAVILIFASIAIPFPSDAASFSNYEKAMDLKILGLLSDSPDNFDLGRSPSRLDCAVLLVRLLGMEKQAEQHKYSHPFIDVPESANACIGYLYQDGILKGVSGSKFGTTEPMSTNEYFISLLRSLGYVVPADSTYERTLEKAVRTGLLSAGQKAKLQGASSFLWNDLAGITYNALSVKLQGSTRTLLDKLVYTDKTIYKPAAIALGLYPSDVKPEMGGIGSYAPVTNGNAKIVRKKSDLFYLLRDILYNIEENTELNIKEYNGNIAGDFKNSFEKAVNVVSDITGVENYVGKWAYSYNTGTFKLTIQYRYTKPELLRKREQAAAALKKARKIVANTINANMSEYDRELVLHDYIINNTRYDYENYQKGRIPEESHTPYGCLVQGIAVCEGYTKAMKLLCDLSSLECGIVTGKSKNNGNWDSHAWNIIKINGSYYHLDVTGDDPVAKDTSILAHYYFNLSDSEMAISSTWDRSKHPACTSVKDNFYYRNGMVAQNKKTFEKAVQTALGLHKTFIELKVSDYTNTNYSNLSDLIFRTNIVRRYNSIVNEELGIIRIYNIQYS